MGERETGADQLHACRHSFASWCIAAGPDAKTVSTYMRHATVAITLDRYTKLFAGEEPEHGAAIAAFAAAA